MIELFVVTFLKTLAVTAGIGSGIVFVIFLFALAGTILKLT